MAFEPKVNIDLYTDHVRTIEAHTSGEYCRVALDCPETKGNTMIEKKHYLEKHHDDFRTMLMHEPRGHHDVRCDSVRANSRRSRLRYLLPGCRRLAEHVRSLLHRCGNRYSGSRTHGNEGATDNR